MDGGNEQSCHIILFQSRSVCNRNSGIGAKGVWEWGSDWSNFLGGILDFEMEGSW